MVVKCIFLVAIWAVFLMAGCGDQNVIDRKAVISRHNPQVQEVDPSSPFTVGNGSFAFTADITGFQSFPDLYFEEGIPLETKARWAWHSRQNPNDYKLSDTYTSFSAYGRTVSFPTQMDTEAAQWLRQNPHDLPLARIGLFYKDNPLKQNSLTNIKQKLDLWGGVLASKFTLDKSSVEVLTAVSQDSDAVAFKLNSDLLKDRGLSIVLSFPRGYDPSVKNTPKIIWDSGAQHFTQLKEVSSNSAVFYREVDDANHWVRVAWEGNAEIVERRPHEYQLKINSGMAGSKEFSLSVQFSQPEIDSNTKSDFEVIRTSALEGWRSYWESGAAIDFSGSKSPQAYELERRVVLSQYLMGVQERAQIPPQETGLTSSSWYGKFHTEMMWWHSAHWALWGRETYLKPVLDWYVNNLDSARETAEKRGLEGARWSKMVGPDGRESPGGNPLIIWNQPHPVALAELFYQRQPTAQTIDQYAELVDATAKTMSSMLVWEGDENRYSLTPPIWIAQEHYDVSESKNPSFELAYWYTAMQTAQLWRERQGVPRNDLWQDQIDRLAGLPNKDGKYVAIESIPDTFDNVESRNDHPTMVAPWGLLADERVDVEMMKRTLDAVLKTWDFDTRIWGWDYPMIAMTASRLGRPELAVDALLMDAHNNFYARNGHCPQEKVGLPVYLPANGALLSAVAYMAKENPNAESLGFPSDGSWKVQAEGF